MRSWYSFSLSRLRSRRTELVELDRAGGAVCAFFGEAGVPNEVNFFRLLSRFTSVPNGDGCVRFNNQKKKALLTE